MKCICLGAVMMLFPLILVLAIELGLKGMLVILSSSALALLVIGGSYFISKGLSGLDTKGRVK